MPGVVRKAAPVLLIRALRAAWDISRLLIDQDLEFIRSADGAVLLLAFPP